MKESVLWLAKNNPYAVRSDLSNPLNICNRLLVQMLPRWVWYFSFFSSFFIFLKNNIPRFEHNFETRFFYFINKYNISEINPFFAKILSFTLLC